VFGKKSGRKVAAKRHGARGKEMMACENSFCKREFSTLKRKLKQKGLSGTAGRLFKELCTPHRAGGEKALAGGGKELPTRKKIARMAKRREYWRGEVNRPQGTWFYMERKPKETEGELFDGGNCLKYRPRTQPQKKKNCVKTRGDGA